MNLGRRKGLACAFGNAIGARQPACDHAFARLSGT
jgi:hypothetical protein